LLMVDRSPIYDAVGNLSYPTKPIKDLSSRFIIFFTELHCILLQYTYAYYAPNAYSKAMQKAFTTEPMHPIIDDHTQLDRSLDPSVNMNWPGSMNLHIS
jgi:hypothetical protein